MLQSGESASVKVTLSDLGTDSNDYEALSAAIDDAITAFNAGRTPTDPNTFTFDPTGSMGVLTYHGDSTTAPELDFSITAVDDSLIEGHEAYKVTLSQPGGSVAPIPPTVVIGNADLTTGNFSVVTGIKDNDTAVWTLVEDTASLNQPNSSNGLVDEGDIARYLLTLDGAVDPAPNAGALQVGETASIELSMALAVITSLNDFDENSDQSVNEVNPLNVAIQDAINAYNSAAGTNPGEANSFSFVPGAWTVTYHGDSNTSAPQLVIDLNTFEDTGASQGTGTDEHLANLVEPDELFSVSIGNPSDSVGGPPQITAPATTINTTIVDDDMATLTVSSPSVFETSGAQTVQVSITVDNPVQGGFTVDYNTSDITATIADNDYASTFGTLIFAGTPGESKIVTINIVGDDVVEPDETFQVELNNILPTDTDIAATAISVAADGGGVVTILNDDIDLTLLPATTACAE